jgi:MFS family permease
MTDERSRAGTILGSLAFANIAAYAARNGLFNVYPDLRDKFGLQDAKLGFLATAFLLPHALATLLFGWAGDRFDRRRVIAVGLLIAAAAGAAGALATNTTELVISRVVVGLGTAAVVPVANTILGQVYEGPRKASRMAIFNLGLLFGAMVGFFAGEFGFPVVVVVLAVPCVVTAAVIVALPIPPRVAPPPISSASGSFAQNLGGFFHSARVLWRIRTLRWIMVSTTAMAFAAGGYVAWLIDFLERDKGMSKDAATTLLSVTVAGAVAGVVTGGRLADRLRTRLPTGRLLTIAIGMTAAMPCVVACLELPAGAGLYVAGIANLFFMSWYHAPMAVSVDDLAPPVHAAAAQGLVIFTMHLVGTAPSSYVLGVVSDHYSLATAMWVPLGFIAVAALAMFAATRTFAGDAHAAGKLRIASL